MRATLRLLSYAVVLALWIPGCANAQEEGHGEHGKKERPRGSQLFYRVLESHSNAPVLPKTRSAWTQDKREHIGNTGMADEGFTEYPFCYGKMDFTFVEAYGIYPRMISNAQANEKIVNTADMLIDHVYSADGIVWGLTGREFVQTYTATQSELVSVTIMIPSERGTFRVALLEGGPGGKQIGPTKAFISGHSMEWGYARWTAGQAPTVPGQTYALRVWRQDGKPWMPYLHSTGDCYDGGCLTIDGIPRQESDMAMQIVEEPADIKRALVRNADEEGWVHNARSVEFVPRTPNVRVITVTAVPYPPHYVDFVIWVRSKEGKLLAGPKYTYAAGPKTEPRTATFVFATDELEVTPGETCVLDLAGIKHQGERPGNNEKADPVDIRARIYGETQPGKQPAIFNLKADIRGDSHLNLTWSQPFPAPTRIEILSGDGPNKGKVFDLDKGVTEKLITHLWAGHTYDYRLTCTGPTGMVWRTPIYRVRMPRKSDNIQPISQSPPYHENFVTIAPPKRSSAPDYPPFVFQKPVELVNNDFEEGLEGWKAEPEGVLSAADVGLEGDAELKKHGLRTKWGDKMAGFTQTASSMGEQVFEKSTLSQEIATVPGNLYVFSAMVNTSLEGNEPRGDTRVRLFAAPAGGGPEGRDSRQDYFSGGRWMRFVHKWRAESDRYTVGFGFFRWRQHVRASAYVDHVHVYDLGPANAGALDSAPRTEEVVRLALTDHKVEAWDKVECHLSAPAGYLITGIGARAHYDNITTMCLKVQPLQPDGSLGEPMLLRDGWEPDSHLEAWVELPEGMVATGFGAAVAPEWDVKRFRVWGRTLNKDGSLGEEKEFRGGADLESGVEKQIRLEEGRVLTSAGLNCMLNDINGIRGTSAKLAPTAAGRSK